MLTLLKKLFLKNVNPSSIYGHRLLAVVCSVLGIGLNLLMFIGKFWLGSISESASITADGFNNLGDAVTNIEMLIGFWFSSRNPDAAHPGGHGRSEWVFGLLSAYAIVTMGIKQFSSSLHAIRFPTASQFSLLMAAVLICSIGLKLYMWFYNSRTASEIESVSMSAVAADCLSDVASTSAVLLCMAVQHMTGWAIDGWCGLLVSTFIIFSGYQAFSHAIVTILGHSSTKEFASSIEEVIKSHSVFKGMHGLMVHDYGSGSKYVSLYVESDPGSDLRVLHSEVDKAAYELYSKLGCEAIIGIDLIINDPEILNPVKHQILNTLQSMDSPVFLHDFKLTQCLDHIDVIVNIEVPLNKNSKVGHYKESIKQAILSLDSHYRVTIKSTSYRSPRAFKKIGLKIKRV